VLALASRQATTRLLFLEALDLELGAARDRGGGGRDGGASRRRRDGRARSWWRGLGSGRGAGARVEIVADRAAPTDAPEEEREVVGVGRLGQRLLVGDELVVHEVRQRLIEADHAVGLAPLLDGIVELAGALLVGDQLAHAGR